MEPIQNEKRAVYVIRAMSRTDVDAVHGFARTHGVTVEQSAGYRGVFIRLTLNNTTAEALRELKRQNSPPPFPVGDGSRDVHDATGNP